jgi:hypothetical protein
MDIIVYINSLSFFELVIAILRGFVIFYVYLLYTFIRLIYLGPKIIYLGPKIIYYTCYFIYCLIWILFGPDFAWSPDIILFEVVEWPCFEYFEYWRRDHYTYYYNRFKIKYLDDLDHFKNYFIIWHKYHAEQMFTVTFRLLELEFKKRNLTEYKGLELLLFKDAILGLINYFILLNYYRTRRPCLDKYIDPHLIVFILLKCDAKHISDIAMLHKGFTGATMYYYEWAWPYENRDYFLIILGRKLRKILRSKYSRIDLSDFSERKYRSHFFRFMFNVYFEIFLKFMNRKVFPFSSWNPIHRDFCGWLYELAKYHVDGYYYKNPNVSPKNCRFKNYSAYDQRLLHRLMRIIIHEERLEKIKKHNLK